MPYNTVADGFHKETL